MATPKTFVFDDRNKRTYLDHLEQFGLPHKAARFVGTTSARVTSERGRDEEFDLECIEAKELFRESIEEEVRRRAIDGVEEGVYFQGAKVDTVTKYSDSLLTLLVKKENPEYGDKLKVDTTITGGVLLTAAPAATPEAWLEAQKRMALGSAPSQNEENDNERIIDVTDNRQLDPVPA